MSIWSHFAAPKRMEEIKTALVIYIYNKWRLMPVGTCNQPNGLA
jgi:hypothetical protein